VSKVTLERVAKRYGEVPAVEALDLEIADGEFLTLLGPSGCGKTTTLRLIAGFIDPSRGRILFDGDDVTGVPPQKRNIGMVFQDYALFPHLTIADNIGFGLRERGVPRAGWKPRVAELLELVRLPGVERRYPAELSGGQQQRVALARAVAHPPRVLLMDEPLGALDLKLREAMQAELRRIQQALKITTVYVTHDQTEAMTLSDRIAVMNAGRVVQTGTAEEIYANPRVKFVADFVGKSNFVPARVVGPDGPWVRAEAAGVPLRVPAGALRLAGRAVTLAIRPERLRIVPAPSPPSGDNGLSGHVTGRSFVGNLVYLTVEVTAELTLTVEVRPGDVTVEPGARVLVTWAPHDTCVLEEEA
jgi:spermidine/putrescine ABC transporter ATP-binding subunit